MPADPTGDREFRDAPKKTPDAGDDAGGDVLLILRPMPDAVPAAIRLRRALKLLLRAYGIRRRAIRPIREGDEEDDGSDAPSAVK